MEVPTIGDVNAIVRALLEDDDNDNVTASPPSQFIVEKPFARRYHTAITEKKDGDPSRTFSPSILHSRATCHAVKAGH